ncbi:MAG: PQQ-binding-like beta-propeller repeat protein [Fuerstiella sp.]
MSIFAKAVGRLFVFVMALNVTIEVDASDRNWTAVGGDRGCMRYSDLDQITVGNVSELEVAWEWKTGELNRPRQSTIECTPIVIDGVMYVSTGHRRVAALNAATGQLLWMFDPMSLGDHAGPVASGGVNRGVAFWSDQKPNGQRRIFHGTSDGRLFSLNAADGKPDPKFGRGGVILLRDELEEDVANLAYGPTSAPAIAGNLVVLGFSNSEGPPPGAPGDIRAFDVRTGKQVWRFHTIARPGEFGAETWQEGAWKQRSGANAWGGLSVDEEREIVFAGTGSAAFDFYGGDRKGDNLFANCVLALDANTGKRIWHFQTLRHDLWDHDLPVYPNLIRLTRNSRPVDAVAQVTKTGYVYVFDRQTGKPLFDIKDIAVPASDIPGEQAAKTQPVPVRPPPFAAQTFHVNDITNVSSAARKFVSDQFATLRSGEPHQPPSLQGTVCLPGFHGGANWSGASFDPQTGLLYLNSNNVPNITRLIATAGENFPYRFAGYTKFSDAEGYPAIKPPWGQLTAIDLNEGTIRWQKTLGHYPALTVRGIPATGTENFGGTITTAGGLVFIGGTMDGLFRAFDKRTGNLVWEDHLPAGGYATPCTYEAEGRQFVCIAAGGAGKLKTPVGESFVAFALPKTGPDSKVQVQPGTWNASLMTEGGPLNFDIRLQRKETGWKATVMNPLEPIEIPEVSVKGREVRLAFPYYDSVITAQLQGHRLVGDWTKVRGAGKVAVMKFVATPGQPVKVPAEDFKPFVGRWSVRFSQSDDAAIGDFQIDEGGVSWGTFLTTTGDYRFLAVQNLTADEARLSCFDGAHAFLFRMQRKDQQQIVGDFWSGTTWHESWIGQRDKEARLPDAFLQTQVLKEIDLAGLRFPDLNGKPSSLLQEEFTGPCRMIQIFGSWCPNCHDAALYLKELQDQYGDQLSIVGLAFEHTGDFERDVAQVRRYIKRHQTPYPVLLAGTSDKGDATKQLQLVDRVRSYPTTIFLDAAGEVQAVYTGFSGPATGEAYQQLRTRFQQTIDRVIAK